MEAANELCRRTQECLSLFQDAAEHQTLGDDDWLEDRAADFSWWAHGLKAQKSGRSSLDHRLRERLDIKKVVAGLLDSLALALREYLHRDEEPESSHDRPDDEACESDKSSTDSSWSDFSDEDKQQKDKDAATDIPVTEDSDPRFYIETNLKLLAKISIAIRRSGARLRYLKADAYLKGHLDDDEYTQLKNHLLLLVTVGPHEQRLLGELRRLALNQQIPIVVEIVIRSWIVDPSRAKPNQQRLIEANIIRRNRIAYARRFIGKSVLPTRSQEELVLTIVPSQFPEALLRPAKEPLSIPDPIQLPPTMLEPAESLTAKTLTATELGSQFVLPVVVPLEPKKGTVSIATKMTQTGIKQDYPACPAKKGTFQCPYCVQVLTEDYTAKSRWRGHVAQDLNPYSCIYQDCPDSRKLYATKEEWTKHIQAQHNEECWACDDCIFESEQDDEFIFESQELWENHMRSRHNCPDDRLKLLCSMSKRVLTRLAECPLCIRPCGHSRPDQDNHISEHLHSWALRALPWDLNPDDEASSDSPEMGSENDLARMSDMSEETGDNVDKTATISEEFDREVTRWRNEILNSSSRLYDLMGGLEDMISKWTARTRLDTQNEIALQHLININQVRAQFLRASDAGLEADEFTLLQKQDIETNLDINIELAIEFMKGIVDEEEEEAEQEPSASLFPKIKGDNIPPTDSGTSPSTSSDSLERELVLGTIANEVKQALAISRSATPIVPSYPLSSMAPVKTFVQRPLLRDSIRNQFTKPLEADRQGEVKKVGVWGMGGVGKSQLALSYLQRYRTEYDATFWIQAGQTASIDRDFLAIYRLLANTSPSLSDLSPEDVKREVLGWFARASGKYLVIFDGADSLHQTDKDFVRLSQYCPGSPNTHIIITSRSSIAKSMSTFEGVSVEELEESQSVELFLACAEIPLVQDGVLAETKLIVHELGYLALAVSMAGKYVSQIPRLSSNLSAYLDEFRSRRRDLLSETPDKLVARYHHSVMTVWETSYDAVSEQLPEAGRLLTLLCFIHFDDIFLELFGLSTDSSSTAVAPWISVLGCQMGADLHQLENWFRVLENYSLCQRKTMPGSYSIHRLVHAWGYDRVQSDGEEVDRYWYAASQLLDNYIETISNRQDGPVTKLRVVPHLTNNIDTFKKVSGVNDWNRVDRLEVVERFGIFFREIGRWNDTAVSQKEVLEKRQRILGDGHPDTISAMSNLAITLGDQGKLDEAASMRKEVLEKMQRILGNEHPNTIRTMNNLANTLGNQGKLDEAASMMKQVLEKRQQILGDGHPDTISAMSNLANTLGNQGKLDEAASMMKQVLEKRQRILGNEHPDTIRAMSNLAITLGDQGKLDEAASMMKQVLEKIQRILGDEHPDTITAMNNLAATLSDQGKLDEAASMRKEVLEKMQRILGDEHPNTITAMSNLAITLGDQGKLDEAASMRKEVLEKRQRILGDEHPDTISAMSNLANTLGDQGKLDEAASMRKEVLEKRQRILGDEHPNTISAMSNLAITLSDQGKLDEAASMRKEVLEKIQRILGNEHPDTITAMNSLANTMGDQGKLDEAIRPPDVSTAKKQRFLKRVTGKLQKVRNSF